MEWRPLKVMEFTETNGGQRERKDIYINGVFKIEMKKRECKEEYLKGRRTDRGKTERKDKQRKELGAERGKMEKQKEEVEGQSVERKVGRLKKVRKKLLV